MERPIAYLKNPAENWLICDRSQQFTQLAEQLYLELTQLLQQGTVPKFSSLSANQ